jgi:cell division protein FtsW (lipid II flippase)
MEHQKKNKRLLIMALAMLVISIFMTFSYHDKIEAGTADTLNKVAYYMWVIFIPTWLFVSVYNFFRIRKSSS